MIMLCQLHHVLKDGSHVLIAEKELFVGTSTQVWPPSQKIEKLETDCWDWYSAISPKHPHPEGGSGKWLALAANDPQFIKGSLPAEKQ